MRALIAISTCGDFERNGNNEALRETWLKDLSSYAFVHHKFFFGLGQGGPGPNHHRDSVILPVQDDYGHLTYKTQSSLRWAAARNYDFVFRCFPDTYVKVNRLMGCAFQSFDYYGDFRSEGNPVNLQQSLNYASGGAGYWLSKKAYIRLLDAPVLGVWRDDVTPHAEDLWVGNRLGQSAPLLYCDDRRFVNHGSRYWPNPSNDAITAHLSCPECYFKAIMYAAHAASGP